VPLQHSGVKPLLLFAVEAHVAHGEAGDEPQERRRAGSLSVVASLLDGDRQELLRFAEKRATDLDGEDQALGFEDFEGVFDFGGSSCSTFRRSNVPTCLCFPSDPPFLNLQTF
jgi:hypothetical protein